MTQKVLKDVAASVRQRLLNIARERNEQFQLVLNRYAIERLLFRLSRSGYRNEFVVKGATLFALWSGHPHRPTRDLDLLGLGDEDAARAAGVFQEICSVAVPDDGLVFDADSISVEPLRAGTDFQGLRVVVRARLGTARIPMQIDIGFGDAVTPPAEEADFPVLLGFPAPRLLFYRRETVVAEKFEATVTRGIANSRMKDFFDIWFLARNFAFEGPALIEALSGTMEQRGVSFGQPIAFTREFFDNTGKVAQWKVFLRRSGLEKEAPALSDVCLYNEGFLMPGPSCRCGEGFRSNLAGWWTMASRRETRRRTRWSLTSQNGTSKRQWRQPLRPMNGWTFWRFERAPGDWVPLDELRR